MNVPAARLAKARACPLLRLRLVPGLHSLGSAAPVEQKAPAAHSASQSSSLVIELSAAIVPFWWRRWARQRGRSTDRAVRANRADVARGLSLGALVGAGRTIGRLVCVAARGRSRHGCTAGLRSAARAEATGVAPPTHTRLRIAQRSCKRRVQKVPGSHAAGICTALPSGQLKPASHAVHAVAPLAPWNLPVSHAEQRSLLAFAAIVPALHCVCEEAPAKPKTPPGT